MSNLKEKPIKKVFIDSNPTPLPLPPMGKVKGQPIMPELKSLKVGSGTSVFCADYSGIWLGAKTWALAPFRVDMEGNLYASSVTITGGTITGTTIAGYLLLAGGTMLGALILAADPVVPLGAATKQYVDNNSGDYTEILPHIVCNNNEVICNGDEVVYN